MKASTRHYGNRQGGSAGFTLVELLVVVSVVALLMSILLPSLRKARAQAHSVVCGSNIHQLATANMMYSADNNGRYCPGAANMLENKRRWHGARESGGEPFDPKAGPLVPFLGSEKAIRACPGFTRYIEGGFESGCGGYGYNQAYLGRVMRDVGWGFLQVVTDETGVLADRVRRPVDTLMFADTAFGSKVDGPIEYSFAEPRFHPEQLPLGARPDPSIHFRHNDKASIAWCDGHVDRWTMTFSWKSGLYRGNPEKYGIGWFGDTDKNVFFDLD